MLIEKKRRTISTVNAHSFSVNLDEVELPSGRITERIRVIHPDASAIVPILDDGRIILVRQYRYSIQEESLEIPAGKIDLGEDPETCAKREFLEETGYRVEHLELLLKYVPAIGYSSEILFIYKGTGISKSKKQYLSSDEISKVEKLTFSELEILLKNGTIKDGKTLLALCTLFHDELNWADIFSVKS